jgi:hypothetical protein
VVLWSINSKLGLVDAGLSFRCLLIFRFDLSDSVRYLRFGLADAECSFKFGLAYAGFPFP